MGPAKPRFFILPGLVKLLAESICGIQGSLEASATTAGLLVWELCGIKAIGRCLTPTPDMDAGPDRTGPRILLVRTGPGRNLLVRSGPDQADRTGPGKNSQNFPKISRKYVDFSKIFADFSKFSSIFCKISDKSLKIFDVLIFSALNL